MPQNLLINFLFFLLNMRDTSTEVTNINSRLYNEINIFYKLLPKEEMS
jgi:hypothetical protein